MMDILRFFLYLSRASHNGYYTSVIWLRYASISPDAWFLRQNLSNEDGFSSVVVGRTGPRYDGVKFYRLHVLRVLDFTSNVIFIGITSSAFEMLWETLCGIGFSDLAECQSFETEAAPTIGSGQKTFTQTRLFQLCTQASPSFKTILRLSQAYMPGLSMFSKVRGQSSGPENLYGYVMAAYKRSIVG